MRTAVSDQRELRTWILLRLTGVVLSLLVLGHFALTHIVNDVAETDAAFVADRFASALFVAWDALMLITALVHGAAGLWIVSGEYAPASSRSWRTGLIVVASALAIFGTITLIVAR